MQSNEPGEGSHAEENQQHSHGASGRGASTALAWLKLCERESSRNPLDTTSTDGLRTDADSGSATSTIAGPSA